MQTHIKLLLGLLTLLSLLSFPQPASAYYDPGVQRWINRDPLGDRISLERYHHTPSSTAAMVVEVREGPNLYAMLANDPVNAIDPLGTISIRFIPFPCPSEFIAYCALACAQQHMTAAPKCSVAKIAGEWYIVLDCGCFIAPWQSCPIRPPPVVRPPIPTA